MKSKIHNCKWLCGMWIVSFVCFVIWQNNRRVDHTITGHIKNRLVYEGEWVYDRTTSFSKDCTWWLSVLYVHLSQPSPPLPVSSQNGNALNRMPHRTLLVAGLFSVVFASLGWTKKHQLGVSHIAWATANGFLIQKFSLYYSDSEKWGKISSENPKEKLI